MNVPRQALTAFTRTLRRTEAEVVCAGADGVWIGVFVIARPYTSARAEIIANFAVHTGLYFLLAIPHARQFVSEGSATFCYAALDMSLGVSATVTCKHTLDSKGPTRNACSFGILNLASLEANWAGKVCGTPSRLAPVNLGPLTGDEEERDDAKQE